MTLYVVTVGYEFISPRTIFWSDREDAEKDAVNAARGGFGVTLIEYEVGSDSALGTRIWESLPRWAD